MKSINKIFPAFVLVPQLLIGVISPNTLAQQPQQEVRKVQKLEQISQILTPEQKQQLRACMQQPMPPQG